MKGFQKAIQQLEDLAKQNHDQADLKVEQSESMDDQARLAWRGEGGRTGSGENPLSSGGQLGA